MIRKTIIAILIITALIFISSAIAFAPVIEKKDPLPSSNFIVEIDGIASSAFTYVEGIGYETEVVEYREGNEKNEVSKIPGLAKTKELVLKRGLSDNTELWGWFKENRDDPVDKRDMSIIILDRSREETVRYNLKDCWPSDYYLEPLESNPSSVAIEVIVIQYNSMERADYESS